MQNEFERFRVRTNWPLARSSEDNPIITFEVEREKNSKHVEHFLIGSEWLADASHQRAANVFIEQFFSRQNE